MASSVGEKTSVVAEQSPVDTGHSPVVTGHSPVVAGQANSTEGKQDPSDGCQGEQGTHTSSVVAELEEDDLISFYQSPSHIAEDKNPDQMEAGDIPQESHEGDIAYKFGDKDWRGFSSTLVAGNWKGPRDWRNAGKGKAFGIETHNFGVRRHDSAELMHVCKVLRKGGAQLFCLQEANTVFIEAVLGQGPVSGDEKWKPPRATYGAQTVASSSDAAPNSAVVTAPSSANAATTAAATTSSVVTERAASHEIYFVRFQEK